MYQLVKDSHRTVRRPCQYCGTKELYRGRTDDGKIIIVDAEHARHLNVGEAFEADAHYRTCPVKNGNAPASPVPEPVAEVAEPEAPKPKHDAIADNRLAILEQLFSSGLTEDDVKRIVNEQLAGQDRPQQVVIVNGQNPEDRKVFEGHTHNRQAEVVAMLDAGVKPFLVGPAGTGKSMIAEIAAEMLGCERFALVSCDPTAQSIVDIFGFMGKDGYVTTPVREVVEQGGLMFFDEVDKCHPGVFSKTNAIMAARPGSYVRFPDGMVKVHAKCLAMIGGNTYGTGPNSQYVGSNKLDASGLDRVCPISIDYDEILETTLCRATGAPETAIQAVLAVVRHGRRKADEQGLAVVLGMRCSIDACKLIASAFDFSAEQITEHAIRRTIGATDWQALSMPTLVL